MTSELRNGTVVENGTKVEMNGSKKIGYKEETNGNGNHCDYPQVTVVNSRSVNYLLTKLRNKDTQAKVIFQTLYKLNFF